MQSNWSLIVNILLLIGVVYAIFRVIKAHRPKHHPEQTLPSVGQSEHAGHNDIIAVRKIERGPTLESPAVQPSKPSLVPYRSNQTPNKKPLLSPQKTSVQRTVPTVQPRLSQARAEPSHEHTNVTTRPEPKVSSLMVFLLAKENRQLAGYELLQTVLTAGLRFGEGDLFHRHQNPNGQGPVLCSLAAATETGVFDLQNIGAFRARGLCLFMQASGNPTIDTERLSILLDTAKLLSDGLDTLLLDDKRRPLTDAGIERYYQLIHASIPELV